MGRPDPMLPLPYRVTEARAEAPDIVTLTLEPRGAALPRARPGQFNMLYAFGIGEAAISLAGEDAEGRPMHTIRAVGATTRALTALAPGAMIGLRGPFGAAWPMEAAAGRHVLVVAGGLGLAPLRPAIAAAQTAGQTAGQAAGQGLSIIYGTRSPDTILFPDDLEAWRRNARLFLTVDHAAPGWTGRVGVVTACLPAALSGLDPGNVAAFVCGPEVMMRFTAQALADAGVPPAQIWLSMERNMKCGIGHCGHCQYGPDFICRDGPVLRYDRMAARLLVKEI
jgi:NAD(P)H-flavin reductase